MASSNVRTQPEVEPLTRAKLANNQPASKPLTPTAFYTVKSFGYARICLGTASILAPRLTCGLFQLYISNETAAVARLFGVRGIALGGLLITAEDETLPDRGSRELRRSLRANMWCDIIDIFTLAFAVANGHMDLVPGKLLMACAAWGVGMGLLGLSAI